MVRERSAKPLYVSSILTRASNLFSSTTLADRFFAAEFRTQTRLGTRSIHQGLLVGVRQPQDGRLVEMPSQNLQTDR